MTRILILEDSIESLKAITAMAEKVSHKVSAVPVKSLDEARSVLKEAKSLFQAFLLDINLDVNDSTDMSGFTFAREIRAMKEHTFTPIVMITSIVNMELASYRELHCYQYLIKPYNENDIEKLVGKLLFISQTGETRDAFVLVKKAGVNYKIFCKDIVCIKAAPRGVNIILAKEEIRAPYMTIKQLLEKLPEDKFIQVHRMCVINQDYIDYVDMVNSIISLKNSVAMTVEIGVTYKNELRRKLNG